MKDPWLRPAPKGYPIDEIMDVVVEDRIRALKNMNVQELRDVIAWPCTQLTVKKAAERRLRKIEKQEAREE